MLVPAFRAFAILLGLRWLVALTHAGGAPVSYELPATGQVPATYLVTLAIVDAQNPDWIVSTFVAGQPRTVTAENRGKFTETWDGLDENFMPVPPGNYAVKGIYAPARQWKVDGEWHAVTPKWLGGASSWLPTAENWKAGAPFDGDPVNSPMRDVAVGPNGVAVFYYQYLENGHQYPMFDLNQPVGPGQFLRSFPSGGAGGGPCVATDGETAWAFNTDGQDPFIIRTDGKPFGSSPNSLRRNAYIPDGWVADLVAARPPNATQSFVYVAQRGKRVPAREAGRRPYAESATEFVNEVTVHQGEGGKIVARVALPDPQALGIRGTTLYALHGKGDALQVSSIELVDGLPAGSWRKVFSVPREMKPADLAVDRAGRFYLSDPAANKVFQLDAAGKTMRAYGRLPVQKPGSYDRESLMHPEKITTWTDAQGHDRLLIVEVAGPNRVSEWGAETGAFLRDFMTYQTKANSGYCIDPADASRIYLPGHEDWLTRFKIDYTTGEWKIDAVWPNVPAGQREGLSKPSAIRAHGNFYLASEQSFTIYRHDAARDLWVQSAGLVQRNKQRTKEAFFWNDANNNGQPDDAELRPTQVPAGALTYHGQKWLADLSYVGLAQESKDLWRAAPEGFDPHGNPIFSKWQKVLTDPVFVARAEGKADSIRGGNELAESFTSDWMQADGSMREGFYVQARGGKNFSANYGAQHKVSRYVPAAGGGFRLKWRVGRSALQGQPKRGEIQGAMRVFQPINGLLSVIDQSRAGIVLYNEEGLYVDTVFPDESVRDVGIYRQPGEFFSGIVYSNEQNGKIYFGSGKFTPFLYEMDGWSLQENAVRPLTTLPREITISAAQIASPPDIAISLRGGAGKARLARFIPALGGAELDGSLVGWEAAQPLEFASGKEKQVQVRALYTPDQLFLRWHVRLGANFRARPLPPLERIFTHDQQADTLSFYIQGDVNAPPNGPPVGRPGDARFVFGVFEQAGQVQPVAVGMYPHYSGKDAKPQVYRTPVGEAAFAHVGPVPGVQLGHAIDADGKGFVLAARIPRSAIPAAKLPFGPEFRTLVNFDANLGGHDRVWWADSDGSASRETYDEPSEARLYPRAWAPAQFQGLDDGVPIPNWLVAGPFGGPGAEKFTRDPSNKNEVRQFYEAATYPPELTPVDRHAVFTGESIRGYWPDPKQVSWKPASVVALDTRIPLGFGSQVWFGSTWVYAPAETTVTLDLHSHRMTSIRWSLNGAKLEVPEAEYKSEPQDEKLLRTRATRPATLRSGWNHLFFRAYSVGYSGGTPFNVGLVIKAPPEKLWPLRFADHASQQ